MITVSHSAILNQAARETWTMVRDFNNYPAYIDGIEESIIEDSRGGDEVGAVRRFRYGEIWLRQRLVEHSDLDLRLGYAGLGPFAPPEGLTAKTPPPADYQGLIQLTPEENGARTRIDWSVSVDAAANHADSWREILAILIQQWTDSLDRALTRQTGDQA